VKEEVMSQISQMADGWKKGQNAVRMARRGKTRGDVVMKATMIPLIVGCVLTFVVHAAASMHAFVITLDLDNTLILAPTHGMVVRPFNDPPDERWGQAMLQLTYEPNGIPRLFNLVSITVATGALDVGIRYEDGTIAVYNDLTAGVWPLDGSDRINRITLACPSSASCPSIEALREMFRVRSLEIEPLAEPAPPDAVKATSCCDDASRSTAALGGCDPEEPLTDVDDASRSTAALGGCDPEEPLTDADPIVATGSALISPVTGGIIADPLHPRRLQYHNGGPVFIASVGEPEGFLYLGTRNADGTSTGEQLAIINEMQARGINCLYVIGFTDSRYGGDGPADGNPFVNADITGNIDADILKQWDSWFQILDAAGIIVYFNIYDDLIDVKTGQRMNWDLTATGDLHPQEQKYIDAVVNKFKKLKNLIWSVNESANKTYPPSYVPRWKKIAARIRMLDTNGHPIGIGIVPETDPEATPNTGIELYADDPNFDQMLAQHIRPTSANDMYNKMLALWNSAAGKYNVMLAQAFPVNNGADGRQKNWATAMAGAYVMQASGSRGRAWDILKSPDADLNALGYMADFFKSVAALNRMVPRNDLKFGNTKWVLAEAGKNYVAYSDNATANLGVTGLTRGTYNLKWLDCIDGSTHIQNNVSITTARRAFARPASIQAACAALSIAKQ
jgi:hypothetical protein